MTTEPAISDEKLAELRAKTDGKYTSMALSELASRRAAEVGMVLVPVEPTSEMKKAAVGISNEYCKTVTRASAIAIYRAMLSARPK